MDRIWENQDGMRQYLAASNRGEPLPAFQVVIHCVTLCLSTHGFQTPVFNCLKLAEWKEHGLEMVSTNQDRTVGASIFSVSGFTEPSWRPHAQWPQNTGIMPHWTQDAAEDFLLSSVSIRPTSERKRGRQHSIKHSPGKKLSYVFILHCKGG